MVKYFYGLFLLLAAVSCNLESEEPVPSVVDGLKPVYFSGNWQNIETQETRPLKNLGKIYYKDSLIYVTEKGQGVHIIDNRNPTNPQPLQFINVPGVVDMAIKGNVLYVDNYTDLVALDIADYTDIRVLKRVEGLYELEETAFPENYSGFFECVDPEAGAVIGWEQAVLRNPKCRRD